MSFQTQTDAPAQETAGVKKAGSFSALRHRDFALFWAGLFVSATGSWMQNVAQGWLVFQLTHSELKLGIVTAMGTFPILLTTLHAGVAADRFNKRKIVIITQTLALVQALILAILALTHVIQVWHILVLASFAGFVNALDVPARQAMTIELVGREDLLNAVALNSSAFNGARIIGPVIAGIIVSISSPGMCFLVNAISFLAIIFMLVIVRPNQIKAAENGTSMGAQIMEGVRYVRENRLIFDLTMLTAFASLFVLQYATLMPALAKEVLHVNAAGYGTLVSGAGIGALAAALSVAGLGHLLKQGMIVSMGSLVVPFGILGLSYSHIFALSTAFMIIIGFGMMLFLAVSNSLIQVASPDELRGRVISVRTLVFMGFAPVGALAVGTLAQYAGVQMALAAGAIVFLLSTVLILSTSNAIRTIE